MWFFGKKKDKQDEVIALDERGRPPVSTIGKTDAQRQLLAQMRVLRDEIGEENLQKLAEKLKLEDIKRQIRHDIDHDEKKRDRLLDELRYSLREEK